MNTRNIPCAFVIGTGRCGSTLISNMLNEHPAILSLSEFFTFITDLGTKIHEAFPEGIIQAQHFWNILSTPYSKQNIMLRHHVEMNEVLYPIDQHTMYSRETGIPAILQTTLPHLTEQHDQLFNDMRSFILSLPDAPIDEHYRSLFHWLTQQFNRKVWVERSGGNLRVIRRLYKHFPEAKFIHIIRDGRNCALSMQQHYGFKMVMVVFQLMEILGIDPYESNDRSFADDLPDDLAMLLPENFSAEGFLNYEVDASVYAHYWSGEIRNGLKVLSQIPSTQILTIQYEELFSQPKKILSELLGFLDEDFVDDTWIEKIIGTIKTPSSDWKKLNAEKQNEIYTACRPGFEAIQKYTSVHYM